MNGWGSRPLTYSRPLTTPTAIPVASMAATARAADSWSRQTIDPTTALSERVAPDRQVDAAGQDHQELTEGQDRR